MKIDNNKKYPIMLSSIAIAVMVAMIALVPMVSQQQQIIAQQEEEQQPRPGSVLKLSRANVPIDIPLAKGYENGNEIFFIATDASDEKIAQQATKLLGFKVNFAPLLSQTPESALSEAYAFTNGLAGQGP